MARNTESVSSVPVTHVVSPPQSPTTPGSAPTHTNTSSPSTGATHPSENTAALTGQQNADGNTTFETIPLGAHTVAQEVVAHEHKKKTPSVDESFASAAVPVPVSQYGVLPQGYAKGTWLLVLAQWYIIIGNIFEWYEFNIYGYLSSEMNINFFQGNSNLTWLVFALSFIMRPLGALFFGWLGDVHGRRIAMLLSIIGMTIATVLPGCLPTYYSSSNAAGTAGLVIFIILRALQGFCVGGEVGTCSVQLAELKDKRLLGAGGGIMLIGAYLGALLAIAIVDILTSTLTTDQMNLWGWRIPYLVVAIPGLIAIIARSRVRESHVFEMEIGTASSNDTERNANKKDGTDYAAPGEVASIAPSSNTTRSRAGRAAECARARFLLVWDVMRYYPLNCLAVLLGVAGFACTTYVGGTWGLTFVEEYGVATVNGANNATVVMNIVSIIGTILIFPLVDMYGVGRVVMVLLLIAVPATAGVWSFMTAMLDNAAANYMSLVLIGVLKNLAGNSVQLYWVAELFPTNLRVTGFLFYNITFAIFGGLGPLFSNVLVDVSVWAPMAFNVVCVLCSAITVTLTYRAHNSKRITAAHLRPELY